MPIIRIEMWEGRSLEQKRELVRVFTADMARISGCEPADVYVLIDDVTKSNWGAGGQLASDKYPD